MVQSQTCVQHPIHLTTDSPIHLATDSPVQLMPVINADALLRNHRYQCGYGDRAHGCVSCRNYR